MAINPVPAQVVLPSAPDRNTQQGNTFSNAARTWSFALPDWGDWLNSVGSNVYNNSLEAEGFATTATNQAVAAANSATLSEQWATTTGALVNATDYSAKEYAIGTTVESAKRHASGTVATGSAKDWASSTTEVADGLKGSRGYAQDSQTVLSDVQSVIALAETVPFTLTSGDDFDSLSKVWPLIRTAFETNSLPWKPIVNLDFARDNYESYVGLSAGTTRAPLLDLATFSRASSATGVNAFGNVETVGANQPRIVFENGVAKGILLENTATNVATWSETDGTNYPIGSAANWAGNLQTVGGITLDDQTATPVISKDFSSSSSSAVASIFFYDDGTKDAAGSKQVFRLECRGDTTAVANIFFDYATKSFSITSNPSYITYDAEKIGGGLYRIFLKCDSSTVTNITDYRVATYSDATYRNTLGGLQVELSTATPSSYIKTTTTGVVRAADGLHETLPAQFNPNGNWAIRGEFTTKSNVFDTSVAFTTITDDTVVNEVTLRPDASGFMSLLVNANSVAISASSSVLLAYDTVYKFMIVKDGSNYHLYLNGLLAATAVNTEAFDATVVKFGQGRLDSTKTNLIYSDHQIYTAFDYDADFDVFSKVVTGV